QHSMGYEVRESPMHQVRAEHMQIGASYWDPQGVMSQQEYEDKQRSQGDQLANAERAQAPKTIEGAAPGGPPAPKTVVPKVETPKIPAEAPKMQGEMTLPEEPELVSLSTVTVDAATGAPVGSFREQRLLVPTGC